MHYDNVTANEQRLSSIVSGHGMTTVQVPKDGDCLFSSVCIAILNILRTEDSQLHSDTKRHLAALGFDRELSIEKMSVKLRDLMVTEWRQNPEMYKQKLTTKEQEKFDMEIQKYRKKGEFCGELGDLMVMSLTNVLKIPFVLFTPIENFPVLTIYPSSGDSFSDSVLYLAYNNSGAGHYDLVKPRSELKEKMELSKSIKCHCGKNDKTLETPHCEKRIRLATRCPCAKNATGCTSSCRCKNCQNTFGKRKNEQNQSKKRKREEQELSGDRLSGRKYMEKEGEVVAGGRWTNEETVLLLEILSVRCKDDIEQLCNVYNNCVSVANNFGMLCSFKNKVQIERKLVNLQKKKELVLLNLEQTISSQL